MNGDDPQAPENLIDLLDRLAEPPQPTAVPIVPQTAGWTVLVILLALGALWLGWHQWQRWRADAYRRAALVDLQAAGDDPAAVAEILRRAALAAWPRSDVAALSGDAWLDFLDRSGGMSGFGDGPGAALTDAPYRAGGAAPVPGLGALAARWIRRHKPAPAAEPAK